MSFLPQPISLTSLFGTQRQIADIKVNVILNEATTDKLTITKQPVQQGANISDHAFKEPTIFSMNMLFEHNLSLSLNETYQQLLDLQVSRLPFDIITPKRIYKSMLIGTLNQTTDAKTENCLAITASFEQIIIVQVSAVSVARNKQKTPAKTGKTIDAGKKSALLTAKEGIGNAFKVGQ